MPTKLLLGRNRVLAEVLLIATLGLTLNLLGNGRISLFDRDEPRYAGATREMIARGDWLVPTFNGEPRYHKPVLIYWLMRAGFAVGGDNPFGARMISSLAGVATSLVVLLAARRRLGPGMAFFGALMLVTSPIMVVESKLATTDATLALWIVGAMFCLWELHDRPSRRVAMGFWVLLALASLTKGPVGPALIAAAGLASWWLGGPTEGWRRLEWRRGLPLFLAISAPWYVAIGILSDGDFYRFAIGRELVHRTTTAMEAHRGFPGYYVVTSLATFHPWSALLPAAVVAAWGRRESDPRIAWLLGWLLGPLILLECVTTKLVHYYLPAYPAAALLSAWLCGSLVSDGLNLRRIPMGRLGIGLLGGVGIGLVAVLTALAVVLPPALRWPSLAVGLVIALGTLAAILGFQRAATARAVVALATAWGLALAIVGGWLLPAAEPYRMSRRVGEALARVAAEKRVEPLLLSFQEPTVIHAMKRSAILVRDWAGFDKALDHHGVLVSPLLAREMKELRGHDDLELEPLERLSGFNLNKGARQEVTLTLIRRRLDSSRLASIHEREHD